MPTTSHSALMGQYYVVRADGPFTITQTLSSGDTLTMLDVTDSSGTAGAERGFTSFSSTYTITREDGVVVAVVPSFKRAIAAQGGGGGVTIQPGQVYLGGTSGGITLAELNTAAQSPVWLNKPLPEGVTLANMSSCRIHGVAPTGIATYDRSLLVAFPINGAHASASVLSKYEGAKLPASVAFSALSTCSYMFYGSELVEFDKPLPKAEAVGHMFGDCKKLTRASITAPMMTNSGYMFTGCSALSSITLNAPNITQAASMFAGCVLDLESVQHLADVLPQFSDGVLHQITIGVDSAKVTQAQQDASNETLVAKRWTVTWQRNTAPTE